MLLQTHHIHIDAQLYTHVRNIVAVVACTAVAVCTAEGIALVAVVPTAVVVACAAVGTHHCVLGMPGYVVRTVSGSRR